MKDYIIGFIGLGLIGGSIAKAYKKTSPSSKVIAFDVNMQSLLESQNEGVVDIICTDIDDSFCSCDFIFLCAPVLKNAEALCRIAPRLSDGCILTDVGSVKGNIMSSIRTCGLTAHFIGGHPMAGSEKSGYQNSHARILENAYYILTPSEQVSSEQIEQMKEFVAAIGSIPVVLDAGQHDLITAAISHLPHILAASLVDFVREQDNDEEIMRTLAAGGFKDITRIASSSPAMWRDICLTNNVQICTLLEEYISKLNSILQTISSRDASMLYTFFEGAKEYRDSMQDASLGPIKKAHVLYCDIPDETGIIAMIASLLASHAISIRNIGIIHNREFEEGALRIEFYDEDALHAAGWLLRDENYTVYERS